MQYLNEITKIPQELTSPEFYAVLAGDPWMVPGGDAEKILAADRAGRKARREQALQQQRQLAQQHQAPVRGARPPAGLPLAPGKNNNVQTLADIDIMAHDDTVQPGQTYRYKLRYRLFNPTWKQAAPRTAGADRAVRHHCPR
jgi:hypothetical protein